MTVGCHHKQSLKIHAGGANLCRDHRRRSFAPVYLREAVLVVTVSLFHAPTRSNPKLPAFEITEAISPETEPLHVRKASQGDPRPLLSIKLRIH